MLACRGKHILPLRSGLVRYYTNGPQRNDLRKSVQQEIQNLRKKAQEKAQEKASQAQTPQTSEPSQTSQTTIPPSQIPPQPTSHQTSTIPPLIKPENIPVQPRRARKIPWWVKHVGVFTAFAAISFGISVYSIEADDPLYYIRKLSDRLAPLKGNDAEKITKILKDLARYSQTNDLLRRKIVQDGHISTLLNITENGATVEIKNLAARIIGNASLEDTNKERLVNSVEIQRMIDILKDDTMNKDMPLYSRKALAMAVARCAAIEKLRPKLAALGVPSVLAHVQEHEQLKRDAFDRAIAHIASSVVPLADAGSVGDVTISHEDMVILRKAYTEEKSTGTLGQVRNTLVDNGLTMYLHTSLGGAVWGACEALRNKGNLTQVLKSSAKTALITGLVPIYFVGMGVSLYNHYQRQVNSSEQRFYLTLATTMSLYPWVYLLPIVERFSPYWLGGHVLGFTSFFVWLLISKNDLLKSDTLLVSEDEIREKRRAAIKA